MIQDPCRGGVIDEGGEFGQLGLRDRKLEGPSKRGAGQGASPSARGGQWHVCWPGTEGVGCARMQERKAGPRAT